jgi:hypothetical protein
MRYEIIWPMTFHADIIEHLAPAEPLAADPRIAVAEVWLCMLGGLVQTAKRLYRFLVHELAPDPHGSKGSIFAERLFGDPITALRRVVRALRFAALLKLKIETEMAALKACLPLGPHAFLSRAFRTRALCKAGREAAANDQEEGENLVEREAPERSETLSDAEPLSEDEKFQALLRGSLKNAIAAICDDLGLKPDWRLWTDKGFRAPPGGGVEGDEVEGGEVEDWVAFFDPGPVTPPAQHIWDGRSDEAWRSAWPPPDRHDSSPPPDPSAKWLPDRGASP